MYLYSKRKGCLNTNDNAISLLKIFFFNLKKIDELSSEKKNVK